MDTTEKIAILCDGDRCTSGYIPAEIRHYATVSDLLREHEFMSLYEDGKKAILVICEAFVPVFKEASKVLYESFFDNMFLYPYDLCSFDMCFPYIPDRPKWYNPIDRHHYRKMHRITPRRVVKRRYRQSRGNVRLLKVERGDEEVEE